MLNSRVRKEQKENGGKVWIVQNENQSYGEISPYTDQNHYKVHGQQMLERVWGKGNPPTLLMGM